MAHNFRILDGDWYISKSGHDSNDGLTPDTPKRTLSNGMYGKIVFGAGHYTEGRQTTSNNNIFPVADGKVILDGMSFGSNYPRGSARTNGLELRNMGIRCRQGTVYDLVIKDGSVTSSVSDSDYIRSIIIRSNVQAPNNSQLTRIHESIMIDCTGEPYYMTSTYVNKSSEIRFFYNTFHAKNCNFRGVVLFAGSVFSDGVARRYCIQDELVGTPQDNGYASNVKWLNETNLINDGYTGDDIDAINDRLSNCINREPLFNAEDIDDYSLQAGSPHIGTGVDGVNIGGTNIASTLLNNSHGVGNVEVIPSPEIDTTNPNAYTLKVGEVEGYIDYIQKISSSNVTLGKISPIASLNFNSDVLGGDLENKNVPDSEPLTYDYPREFITSSDAQDSKTLVVSGHNAQINEWVRVNGEDREIISVTSSTITVGLNFRANVSVGTLVMVGSKPKIGALRPNRLTYLLRTSKQNSRPTLLSDWDNDIDPIYNKSGHYLTQEWDTIPGYFIDTDFNTVFGSGDSETPIGLTLNEISCKWINLRVYIRNNYKS